jgi:hypothetical protein
VPRSYGRKQASRGAQRWTNLIIPFLSTLSVMVKSSSSPSPIDVADHTIVLRVSLRVCRAYSRILSTSVVPLSHFAEEHHRRSWFLMKFWQAIVHSVTTIVFPIFSSFDCHQREVRGCPVAAAPSSSDRRHKATGGDDVVVGSPNLFDLVVFPWQLT